MAHFNKPDFIDLPPPPRNFDPSARSGTPSPGELNTGDIPPALSPLDAFAFQSRMLASQFHEKDGHRISRLPPLTVANEFARPRTANQPPPQRYPHSNGDDQSSRSKIPSPPSGESPQVFNPTDRHRSFHPFIQTMDDRSSICGPYSSDQAAPGQPTLETLQEERSPDMKSLAVPHSTSAGPWEAANSRTRAATTSKVDFAPPAPRLTPPNESVKSNFPNLSNSLAPPRSPAYPRSPHTGSSVKSLRMDSGDDNSDALSFQSDPYDLRTYERKPSTSSHRGRPISPYSPVPPPPRSPSVSSDHSGYENPLQPPRRSMNFSRPLSPNLMSRSQGISNDPRPSYESSTRMLSADSPDLRPSMDVLSVNESIDNQPLQYSNSNDHEERPYVVDEVEKPTSSTDPEAGQSYTYTKYSLPRGRVVSRSSLAAGDWLNQKINWDQPAVADKEPQSARPSEDIKASDYARPSYDDQSSQYARPSQDTPTAYFARPSHDYQRMQHARPSQDVQTPRNARPSNDLRPNEDSRHRRGLASADLRQSASEEPIASGPSGNAAQMSHNDIVGTVPPVPQDEHKFPTRSRSHDGSLRSPKKSSDASGPTPPVRKKSAFQEAPFDDPPPVPASNKPALKPQKSVFKEASFDDPPPKPKSPVDKAASKSRKFHFREASFDDKPPKLTTDKSAQKSRKKQTPQKDPFEHITPHSPDQLSPEVHLARGIASHEEGALQKSTYHFRVAARAGLPTGMLLYALACRHGWGMRANQSEGVIWLRKAVDSTNLQVQEGENASLTAPAMGNFGTTVHGGGNLRDQRSHQAQLALATYELGVSYMNGWGVGQDKSLALRCFDIAGNWGDPDALAEAGFCYAKGVGTKKDLKKAAALYRKAEEKGISMTGNSWIYKDKYMPPREDSPGSSSRKGRSAAKDDKDKKPRNKSRTRTIFGRARKDSAPAPPNA